MPTLRRRRPALCAILLLALAPVLSAAAEEDAAEAEVAASAGEPSAPFVWTFTGALNLEPNVLDPERPRLHDSMRFTIDYRYDFLHAAAALQMINDGRYTPAHGGYTLDHYFLLEKGGLTLDFDSLSVKAGRFEHHDVVESPYSLFISSESLPAMLADVDIHGGLLTYQSRWIRLNQRSALGYRDRGANYKLVAFNVGDFRFGVQESAVYVDRSFDLEYFASPMPYIFTQIALNSPGKPWYEEGNDNTLMGLFFDWRRPGSYLYAQWLIDDINLEFLVPEFLKPIFQPAKIPQKMAWSLGGAYAFPFGTLGLYHAGATKYVFAATQASSSYSDYPYEYAYYPAVEYTLGDGTPMTLHYLDNYIGYKYGENNIAFLLDYAPRLPGVDLHASLEYVISGSKSPANPWHEYRYVTDTDRKTKLLDDAALEHTLSTRVGVSWRWRNLLLFTDLLLGGVFNALELEEAVAGEPRIFRPQPGVNRLLYGWTVGLTHYIAIGR